MNFERGIVKAEAKRIRLWVTGAFLIALAATILQFGQFLANGIAAVHYPWQLDYGEGIVWEQMRLMMAGQGYGKINGFPAIVFHYPPAFHMLTAAISGAARLDPLAVGRSVSIGSTLLIGLFAGLITAKAVRADSSFRTAVICGLVAGLTTFCFSPIALWAPLMRVDMLSIALSFGGLFTAMVALTRLNLIFASAFLFVAAVFTKQTSIVAPAAVFITYLFLRPRLAWLLAAGCGAIGLTVLATLEIITDGGFFRHIFLYNVNRFDPSRLKSILVVVCSHSLFVVVLVVGVFARLRARLPHYRRAESIAVVRQRLIASPGDSFFVLVLLYALLAGLMTLSVAKSGSNLNYFNEWLAVLAILLGISARNSADFALGVIDSSKKRPFEDPVLLPLLIGIQALMIGLQPLWSAAPADTNNRPGERLEELRILQSMVHSASRPVISDDMVLLVRSGMPVQWEPAIFAELASTGIWNEAPFVERIRTRQFAFFITEGVRGDYLFDRRYNPAVADAMKAAYPVQRAVAGYTLHLPTEAKR